MPPLAVIDRSTGTVLGAGTLAITAPRRANRGTQLLALIGAEAGSTIAPADAWTVLETFDTPTAVLQLLRRVVSDFEGSAYDFAVDGAFALGAVLVVRGSAPGDLVDSDASEIAALADFIAPTVTASRYSDALLSAFLVLDEVALVAPTDEVEVASVALAGVATLLVSMQLPEAAGPILPRELDDPASADALAASFLLPVLPAPRPVLIDTGPPGAIGFVTRGV